MTTMSMRPGGAVLTTQPLPLNPWLSMWTQPRKTARLLARQGADARIFVLASLNGIALVLRYASATALGDQIGLPAILAIVAVVGPSIGIITLYAMSRLTEWSGGWLGANVDADTLRIPLAWAGVPATVAVALWLATIAFLGPDLFTTETPRIAAQPAFALYLTGFSIVLLVLAGWGVVLVAKAVSEVLGFESAWRGLFGVALAALVIAGPFVVFWLVANLVVPAMG